MSAAPVVWDDGTPLETIVAQAPFLAGVPAEDIVHLCQIGVRERYVGEGEILFYAGDPVKHIYALFEGQIHEDFKSSAGPGASTYLLQRTSEQNTLVGHFDLLLRQNHHTRAFAETNCRTVEFDVAAMQWLLHRHPHVAGQMAPVDIIGRLRTMPLLGNMNLTMIGFLAEVGDLRTYVPGEVFYEAYESIDYLYIVDRGQVALDWPGDRSTLVANGMAFGFAENGSPSAGETVEMTHGATAAIETVVFIVRRGDFRAVTGALPDDAAAQLRRDSLDALRRVVTFRNFDDETIGVLHGYCSFYQLPIHHAIMQQGEIADSMWILLPGSEATLQSVGVTNQALPNVPLRGLSYFGDVALVAQVPMNATIEARPNSRWLRLNGNDFRFFLHRMDHSLDDILALSPEAQELLLTEETRRRYSWLAEDESLLVFQRRHWIELVRKTVPASVSVFLLLLIAGVDTLVVGSTGIFQCLYLFFAVVAVGWLIWGILDYLNDYLLVTTQRVVRQEKVIFINETQQVAFLEQIQNVDYVTNFFGRLLNYGAIQIQTAGSQGRIVFDFVPEPDVIKSTIIRQQGLRRGHYQASSRSVIQSVLEDRFGLRPRLPAGVYDREFAADADQPERGSFRRVRAWLDPHMRKDFQDHVVWRKHVIVLLPKLITPVIVVVFALLIAIWPGFLPNSSLQLSLAIEFVAAFVGLFGLLWSAWVIADWRNDTYEVTQTEVIDIEKKPLFFEEARRTGRLGQIENIDVRIPSPLHFILNYGNVLLQTAATDGNFTFIAVPDPRGVAEELRRRIELYRRREEEERTKDRAQEIPDWLDGYNRLQPDIARDPGDWFG